MHVLQRFLQLGNRRSLTPFHSTLLQGDKHMGENEELISHVLNKGEKVRSLAIVQ